MTNRLPISPSIEPVPSPLSEIASDGLQGIVGQVAQLAHSGLPARDFYRRLLDLLPTPPGTFGAAAWECHEDSFSALATGSRYPSREIQLPYNNEEHAAMLQRARVERRGQVYHPPQQADYQVFVENALPTVGVYPVVTDDTAYSLVEVFLPPNLPESTLSKFGGSMDVLCEIAAGFHKSTGTTTERGDDSFQSLISAVHRSLNVESTCYALANEGRRALGCDRVTVLTGHTDKYRTRAVSGQESINRRANVVRLLEQLTARVLATGEPFWYPTSGAELAPQIEKSLEQYIEASMCRRMGILPLRPALGDDHDAAEGEVPERRLDEPCGALVVEDFVAKTDPLEVFRSRCDMVATEGAAALKNALDHEMIFLLPLMRTLTSLKKLFRGNKRYKTLTVLGALAIALLILCVYPKELQISSEGKLQPVVRQHVFARVAGTVHELYVDHGDQVTEGAPLLLLRNQELDLAIAETRGEITKTQTRLSALRAQRFTDRRRENSDGSQDMSAASEAENMRALLDSLKRELEIRESQRELLAVNSPINGEVMTWNLEERLRSRPVEHGQLLLDVAQLDGPWILELNLPDRRIAHVLRAEKVSQEPLQVTFLLASQTARTYTGRVVKIAKATRVDPEIGQNLLITVEFDSSAVEFRKPGSVVQAKIHCGKKPLGYVWFHSVFEFIQSRVLFKIW